MMCLVCLYTDDSGSRKSDCELNFDVCGQQSGSSQVPSLTRHSFDTFAHCGKSYNHRDILFYTFLGVAALGVALFLALGYEVSENDRKETGIAAIEAQKMINSDVSGLLDLLVSLFLFIDMMSKFRSQGEKGNLHENFWQCIRCTSLIA
jgi:hypothetical protein